MTPNINDHKCFNIPLVVTTIHLLLNLVAVQLNGECLHIVTPLMNSCTLLHMHACRTKQR
jgi:hypothetical protein